MKSTFKTLFRSVVDTGAASELIFKTCSGCFYTAANEEVNKYVIDDSCMVKSHAIGTEGIKRSKFSSDCRALIYSSRNRTGCAEI
jgi:hypothetical protein